MLIFLSNWDKMDSTKDKGVSRDVLALASLLFKWVELGSSLIWGMWRYSSGGRGPHVSSTVVSIRLSWYGT